ncbi:hypothetical protein [Sutterella sp.]|uniref:hypothetical protein n=1 Tax=Sutterella sp. TaxID=1981025 RepID=UPI0026DEEA22|nr:hypothetical protein [Sutterella sp.]MDO5532476.1 hypothetical protein [Sutterella sp.]
MSKRKIRGDGPAVVCRGREVCVSGKEALAILYEELPAYWRPEEDEEPREVGVKFITKSEAPWRLALECLDRHADDLRAPAPEVYAFWKALARHPKAKFREMGARGPLEPVDYRELLADPKLRVRQSVVRSPRGISFLVADEAGIAALREALKDPAVSRSADGLVGDAQISEAAGDVLGALIEGKGEVVPTGETEMAGKAVKAGKAGRKGKGSKVVLRIAPGVELRLTEPMAIERAEEAVAGGKGRKD